MAEITITTENFEEEVLRSDKPVLLDFWAAWCGPCQMLAPIIAEIAQEQGERIKVCKVNVDEESALAVSFHVTSIPTVLVMQGGKVKSTSVGYRSKEQLIALLG